MMNMKGKTLELNSSIFAFIRDNGVSQQEPPEVELHMGQEIKVDIYKDERVFGTNR